MGLIQEVQALKYDINYSQKELLEKIDDLEKQLEKERNYKEKKISQSEIKTMLKNELFDKLYKYFDDNKGDFFVNGVEICNKFFQKTSNRTQLINEIGTSEFEYQYLNQIFDTTLKKIYNIFTKDYWERWEELPKKEQIRIRNINIQKGMTQTQQQLKEIQKEEKNSPLKLGNPPKEDKPKAGFLTTLFTILNGLSSK